MFNPNSPLTRIITDLFFWSMVVGGLVFALVTGLVLYAVWRYRGRAKEGEPRQVSGNTRLEIAWTIAPTLIVVAFFIPTLTVMRATQPPQPHQSQEQPDIIVTGYQWWWRIEYPQSGVVTANEIHIPVGERLLVRLEANEVIHSFWVPELNPKQDMVPGHPTNTWLSADQPGVYDGACAEYCGVQHAWMRIRVIAETRADFDRWQQAQLQPLAQPTEATAVRGAQLYNQLTCVNCHAIGGQGGAQGVGPDLTHLASRQTLAAGRLENTPENLALWLANPEAFKPGVYMPGYGRTLSREDLQALVAYLETLQ
jgi:cytochrome c oxidase subunit 2